jgi:predicted 3-demethylubiquinone-9 3-methyltransferase (glyoxalase superfamily)
MAMDALRDATQRIVTFLTFPGTAEEAMNYYVGLFPKGRVVELTRFGKDQQGPEGKLLNGTFELLGQRFYVMDMEPGTPPAFSWATSILVHCADEAEFDALFAGLSRGGSVMMGPEPVMEIRKAAWVTDRFGVTWQLIWV